MTVAERERFWASLNTHRLDVREVRQDLRVLLRTNRQVCGGAPVLAIALVFVAVWTQVAAAEELWRQVPPRGGRHRPTVEVVHRRGCRSVEPAARPRPGLRGAPRLSALRYTRTSSEYSTLSPRESDRWSCSSTTSTGAPTPRRQRHQGAQHVSRRRLRTLHVRDRNGAGTRRCAARAQEARTRHTATRDHEAQTANRRARGWVPLSSLLPDQRPAPLYPGHSSRSPWPPPHHTGPASITYRATSRPNPRITNAGAAFLEYRQRDSKPERSPARSLVIGPNLACLQGKRPDRESGRVRLNPAESGHDWHKVGTRHALSARMCPAAVQPVAEPRRSRRTRARLAIAPWLLSYAETSVACTPGSAAWRVSAVRSVSSWASAVAAIHRSFAGCLPDAARSCA